MAAVERQRLPSYNRCPKFPAFFHFKLGRRNFWNQKPSTMFVAFLEKDWNHRTWPWTPPPLQRDSRPFIGTMVAFGACVIASGNQERLLHLHAFNERRDVTQELRRNGMFWKNNDVRAFLEAKLQGFEDSFLELRKPICVIGQARSFLRKLAYLLADLIPGRLQQTHDVRRFRNVLFLPQFSLYFCDCFREQFAG